MSQGDSTSHADAPGSTTSSSTHVQTEKGQSTNMERNVSLGHGESDVLPDEKVDETTEDSGDDWETDPENARNWTQGRKWAAVGVVRYTWPRDRTQV